MGVTAAILLLYVAVLGTFGSQANQRLVDVGGLLIVICGALCLNAVNVSTASDRNRYHTENRDRGPCSMDH
jgi:phosphatidylserine synthase